MTVLQRALAPTPRFFKKLRLLGIILSAIGGAVLGRKTSEPVKTVAEHIATAGVVIAAISQVTVDEKAYLMTRKTPTNGK